MSKRIKLSHFVLLLSLVNLILYQYPFYKFVVKNSDVKSLNGIILLVSLTIAAILLNAMVFYIGLFLLRVVGKWLLVLFFNISAIAVYFINSYGVIIDRTMIGNVFNTDYEEATSFFSFGMLLYVFLLGILPSVLLFKFEVIRPKFKKFLVHTVLTLILLGVIAFANSPNWLWIDKNSKTLGGLVMPWSYVVNTSRYYSHINKKNKKEILLPNANIRDTTKSIAVLVIGESARSQNFSLYGYEKQTNPLLTEVENLHAFNATSCATYTTAGVKCILEHKNSNKLYELLPNYLYRNDVDVIWRTTNWGQPPIHIKNFLDKNDLRKDCQGEGCKYDENLLRGLKEQIAASTNNKILVVLHTSTSHGPSYNKKYPPAFEKFKPVCESVELGNCTSKELINAYDNTIVYTDFILSKVISTLKEFEEYSSTMLFVSDHGESLGENNLYMHGIPASIAPDEQLDIPFIVWLSEGSRKLKANEALSQNHVFHSILNFLAIDSPIYNENMNIFD